MIWVGKHIYFIYAVADDLIGEPRDA